MDKNSLTVSQEDYDRFDPTADAPISPRFKAAD